MLLGPPRPATGAVICTVNPSIGSPFTAEVWPMAPDAPGPNLDVDPAVARWQRFKWWATDTAWIENAGLKNGDTLEIEAGSAWDGLYTVERVDDRSDPEAPEASCVRR